MDPEEFVNDLLAGLIMVLILAGWIVLIGLVALFYWLAVS